ncbi:hypothetical protein [Scytonema sp. PCC 10023]|uniref:hypothetical protein n=1 Tax=Scytonema sp. PCC 10023 TaxID=1680591 RepID=UPI0039C684EB
MLPTQTIHLADTYVVFEMIAIVILEVSLFGAIGAHGEGHRAIAMPYASTKLRFAWLGQISDLGRGVCFKKPLWAYTSDRTIFATYRLNKSGYQGSKIHNGSSVKLQSYWQPEQKFPTDQCQFSSPLVALLLHGTSYDKSELMASQAEN